MKRRYNVAVCPRWDLPIKSLNIQAGMQFCERELSDMSNGKFPLFLLDSDEIAKNIRLDILVYLFLIYPRYYDNFFALVKEISEKKNVEQILRDCFGEPCELAKKKIPVIEKDIIGMYEEFKNDNGNFINKKFDKDFRLSTTRILNRFEHSLENFVKTGYCHQYEYIEDKYPEAIRVEEELDGEEVEVMDLLFFYDCKKLNVALIQKYIDLFANETDCDVRVVVVREDKVLQQKGVEKIEQDIRKLLEMELNQSGRGK